ncbi:MAG: ubiquinone/menaquinone biosynthesis methyltransferase [Gemmatimonadales bacterium]|nr:ubiquinone/menaquinone biosynthesis methyltransferase [Gemmatimonadales bacterium]
MSAPRPSDHPERLLPRLDLDEHLEDPAIKQRFVTTMFEVIAPRYDRFTRVFSYGMDRGWKRRLLGELQSCKGHPLIVDLACGTGDLAFMSAAAVPTASVVGLDLARRMVRSAASAARRSAATRVRFAVGDMTRLPLPDASADAVTVGYGVRNAPTPTVAIAEIARVLKPGGLLLTLDFYRPPHRLWRRVFLAYVRTAGNLVGWLWHGLPVAYGYIAPSVERYLTCEEFSALLRAHGFEVTRTDRRLLGGIGLHVARRA